MGSKNKLSFFWFSKIVEASLAERFLKYPWTACLCSVGPLAHAVMGPICVKADRPWPRRPRCQNLTLAQHEWQPGRSARAFWPCTLPQLAPCPIFRLFYPDGTYRPILLAVFFPAFAPFRTCFLSRFRGQTVPGWKEGQKKGVNSFCSEAEMAQNGPFFTRSSEMRS